MKVLYKKESEDAVEPKQGLPRDFCYDVVATSREEIAPNIWRYGIGLAFDVVTPAHTEYHFCIEFRPRSSVWKTGMVLSNCVGTIDELYRGEVSAVFYKVAEGKIYEVGDKIGQICLMAALPMEFEEAYRLSETVRGRKGYGSTGR